MQCQHLDLMPIGANSEPVEAVIPALSGCGESWKTSQYGQLLEDSVFIQWEPSHVGVQGNEEADNRACASLYQVLAFQEARDIWAWLGLEKQSDELSKGDMSGGARLSGTQRDNETDTEG